MTTTGEEEQHVLSYFEQYKLSHPQWYYQKPENAGFIEKWFWRPYHNTRFYLRRVGDNFGWRFLSLLVSAYFGIKGYLYTMLAYSQYPYFVQLMRVDGKTSQLYGTVATTPWSMKAFMGVLSDTVPIAGYNKRWWLIIFAFLGSTSYLVLGLVDFPPELAALVSVMYFVGNFEVALVDLLVEGKYAELMVKHPETSSDVVSWVWMNYFVGGLLATWVVGPLGDEFKATGNEWYLKGMFLASLPISVQIVIPIMLNWLGEDPLLPHQRGFQREKWERHRNIFTLALIMGVGALGVAVVSLMNDEWWSADLYARSVYLGEMPILVYAVVISLVVVLSSFCLLPPSVARANTYLFVSMATYIQINGVMDIFYMAGPGCVPDGPHFSQKYYTTVSGTIQSITGFIGVALFQSWMSEWEFRPCFWVSTLLQAIAGLFDIVMVKRWNIAAGLGDKVTYMFGYNIIYNVVSMLNFMPGVVLISKLCPRGMESTLYALLAGFSNFGQVVARSIGVYLISAFGVVMVDEGPCEYGNLALLIALGHIVLPVLVALPATFVLIPKARLTDPVGNDFHIQFQRDESDIPEGGVQITDHVATTSNGHGTKKDAEGSKRRL